MFKEKVWGKNSTWAILLVVLCVAIIELGVGIWFLNNRESDSVFVEDKVNLVEQAKIEIDTIENPTVEQIIDIYQKYIDIADESEVKANLLEERIFAVQKLNLYYKNGEQTISDVIAIDDLLQTVDSAAKVMNIASTYGNDDLFEKYKNILEERETKQGVDISTETEG